MLSIKTQQALVNRFFKAEIRDLEAATEVVVQANARRLKRIGLSQLRRFRKGPRSNGSFHKAVKTYDLKAKGTLGPASYTRFGVPFVGIWQEGSEIQGKPTLTVLLPEGQAIGFDRVSKGNPWNQIWGRLKGKSRTIPVNGGRLLLYRHQGREVPVYLFLDKVKEPKLLSIYEEAEKLAEDMPNQVERLLG